MFTLKLCELQQPTSSSPRQMINLSTNRHIVVPARRRAAAQSFIQTISYSVLLFDHRHGKKQKRRWQTTFNNHHLSKSDAIPSPIVSASSSEPCECLGLARRAENRPPNAVQ
jgi:hypothetical protein